jgi:hypothetical protein
LLPCCFSVLLAPGIGINLFSVCAFAGKSMDIHFTDSNAFIGRNGVLEITASRLEKDLYRLDILILSEDNACLARSTSLSFEDLHRRLNHISYQTIIKMAHTEAVLGLVLPSGQPPTDHCHDCATAKITWCIFPSSNTKSQRIGSLVHSDVCGPMPVNSFGERNITFPSGTAKRISSRLLHQTKIQRD